MKTKPSPLPPVSLTVLQRGDVELLAAVISRPHARVCLHRHAVVSVLPQMPDVDVVGRGGEVQVVAGIPQFQTVVGNDPVRQQRRPPGHVHFTGADRHVRDAIRRTAGD